MSNRPNKKARSRVTRQAGKRSRIAATAAADAWPKLGKIARRDRTTSGIVHDYNNLLMVVTLNLELLGDRVSAADRDFLVRPALQAVRMSAALTRDIVSLSSERRAEPGMPDTGNARTQAVRRAPRRRRRARSV